MWKVKIFISLIFVFVLRFANAQPENDFFDLQHAIENNQRENVIFYYNKIANQVSGPAFNNTFFEQFLFVSHELSRLGYSEAVLKNLEMLSGGNEILTKFSVKHYSAFYNELGYAYYYHNKLAESDSVFQLNIALKELFPEVSDLDVSFAYNFLGLVNRRLGKTDLSLEYFNRSKKIRVNELGENNAQVGAIYNNIGLTYKTKNEYDSARYYFEKAVDIKLKTNDNSVFRNYINLGELLSLLGNYTKALDYYKKADDILQIESDSLKMADVYLNMGGVFNVLKSNGEAYRYYQKALSIYYAVYGQNHENIAKVYQNLANVYHDLGDDENEQQSIVKAISILATVYGAESVELAPMYNNLGMALQKHEKYDQALFNFKKALQIYRKQDLAQSEKYLNTLTNVGINFKFSNETDSALFYLTGAHTQLSALFDGKHPQLAFVANQISELYGQNGDTLKAKEFLNRAIFSNIATQNNFFTRSKYSLDPFLLFESYLILGKLNAKHLNQALHYFYLADSVLTFQRDFIFEKEDKIHLASNSKKLTQEVLNCLWKTNSTYSETDFETIFKYIENSKNLVLLQSISENDGKNFSGIPAEILQKEEQLLGLIHLYEHEINVEKDSIQKSIIEKNLFSKKLEYKALIKFLEKNYSSYFDLKHNVKIPKLAEIQSVIDDETVVLNYFVGENSMFRFQISKTGFDFQKLENADYNDLLTGMRKGIVFKLNEVYSEKASQLYHLLLPENINEYKKIKIIPDGGLSVLPFEALLQTEINDFENPDKWPFLLQNKTISYSPSNSIFYNLHLKNNDLNQKNTLLAVAPVFNSNVISTGVETSFSSNFLNSIYNSNLNSLGLAPLQNSATEIDNINRVFSQQGLKTTVLLNAEATENAVKSADLKSFKYIHIATHGYVDKTNPELSGLFFAPVKNVYSDNILYTGEIYNMQLNAELLTLSACETGLGKVAEGEGLLGFSRAFFYSGAKNLMVSLWKVNDFSTSELMSEFYVQLTQNKRAMDESLLRSKMKFIQEKEYAHPFYWASFVLIGSN